MNFFDDSEEGMLIYGVLVDGKSIFIIDTDSDLSNLDTELIVGDKII